AKASATTYSLIETAKANGVEPFAYLHHVLQHIGNARTVEDQACLLPRDRFWDIPVPKIDSAFDNLFVPQPSWSPSTTQQLRKLVAAPYLSPNDWTPRLDAYFASPLALCARRVSSAASRLLGSTSLRFALHGWQRLKPCYPGTRLSKKCNRADCLALTATLRANQLRLYFSSFAY
uniref:transposase domain-containing protein n=1 Tax=Thiolapillus sp. TaxID=2017437 RepID=UPI003AF6D309